MVVVAGIDQGVVRQAEQFASDAVEKIVRTAVLEIRPAAAVYQKGIATEQSIAEQVREVPIRMARRVQRHQLQAADLKRGAVLDAHVGAGQLVDGRACDTAAGFPLQFQRRGDVIGMYVRIERKRQLQAEARQLGQIATTELTTSPGRWPLPLTSQPVAKLVVQVAMEL